jgi:predicted regulator of Ras-like GTPase activity (Roadblock/LC7/MglB family)
LLKRFARLGTTVEASSHGTITSLGRFILDNETEKAISTIIEGGGQSARILTEQDDKSLSDYLLPIANQPGVAGYMVLGYDGLIVTNRLPEHMDPDSFSAWALLTYMHAQDVISAIGHKRLRQLISRTDTGCVLLCAFGQALLVVISDNAATELIVPLLIKARNLRVARSK